MSGKLKSIGINSDTALNKFSGLQQRSVQVNKNFNALGRSVTTLSDKLGLMRAERDLIPESNIRDVRRYNTEIRKLEKRITRLQTVNNGSRLKSLTRDAMMSIPGGSFLMNPIVAVGGAISVMTGQSLKFNEGMAKINITARLNQEDLGGLRNRLLEVGKAMHADPGTLPETFEKILSQVGDVDTSMSIFETTLKGAKATFTDTAIVADALALSLSAIGVKNTDAESVMNVLVAAKRVGAGEFADYARYVPGLIADARNLGIAFQDTAGLFSFMTAKGNTAEKSAMFMQNAFTALSKTQVQTGLKDNGINIFDKEGNIRNIADIMGALKAKLTALGSDAARSNFLEKIGLKDAQAKTAFSILTSDVDKLRNTLAVTADASGETDAALQLSKNTLQRLSDLWHDVKTSALQAGFSFENILSPIISVSEILVSGLAPTLKFIGTSLVWIKEGLSTGNPLVWGAVAAVGAWAVITKTMAVVQWIATAATGGWTLAMTFLNAAFLASPIGWIVLGVGALVASVIYAWKNFDGFRETVWGLWEAFKVVLTNIGDFFTKIFSPIFDAIAAFKEGRWMDAAKAVGQAAINLNPVGMAVQAVNFAADGGFTKGVGEAFSKGAQKAVAAGEDVGSIPAVPGAPSIDPVKSKSTTPTAEAIATGGRKTQNFNISIGNMVEKFTIENNDQTLGVDEMKDKVLDALMRVLNMSQSLASG
jgi:TP901 family phage tail tape measure protein